MIGNVALPEYAIDDSNVEGNILIGDSFSKYAIERLFASGLCNNLDIGRNDDPVTETLELYMIQFT
jgi:hypothetical protein